MLAAARASCVRVTALRLPRPSPCRGQSTAATPPAMPSPPPVPGSGFLSWLPNVSIFMQQAGGVITGIALIGSFVKVISDFEHHKDADVAALRSELTALAQSLDVKLAGVKREVDEKFIGAKGEVDAKLAGVDAKFTGAKSEVDAKLAGVKGEVDAKLAGARVAAEAEALRVLKDYGVSVAGGKASKE